MGLFNLGDFVLHGGAKATWKIDCDALTEDDIKAVAHMVQVLIGPFGSVEGVPRGGLRLAAALDSMVIKGCNTHLIVDDVLTTGDSMEEAKKTWRQGRQGSLLVRGAVIFARGPCPPWVQPVFSVHRSMWAVIA